MKVSRTLQEVWRWKEEVARETRDMSMSEQIAYFRKAGQRLAAFGAVSERKAPLAELLVAYCLQVRFQRGDLRQ